MGRFDDFLGEITKAELIEERVTILNVRQTLDRRLAAVEDLIALKEGEPDVPPLHIAIEDLFRDNPVARDTDDVMSELETKGWLGGRERGSVNATLGRLANDGILHRARRGQYAWGPGPDRPDNGGSDLPTDPPPVDLSPAGAGWTAAPEPTPRDDDESNDDVPF